MKRLLPLWALLLVAPILVFVLLIWLRAHPVEREGPKDLLVEAAEWLDGALGLQVGVTADPQGGVVVTGVSEGSPAAAVGIEPGDRIVACGTRSVWHGHDLVTFMSEALSANVPAAVMVQRGEKYRTVVFGRRGAGPVPPAVDHVH